MWGFHHHKDLAFRDVLQSITSENLRFCVDLACALHILYEKSLTKHKGHTC